MKLLVAGLGADTSSTSSNSEALSTSPRSIENWQGGQIVRDGLPRRLIWDGDRELNPCADLVDQIDLEYCPGPHGVPSIFENLPQLRDCLAWDRNAANTVSVGWRDECGESWGDHKSGSGHDDV